MMRLSKLFITVLLIPCLIGASRAQAHQTDLTATQTAAVNRYVSAEIARERIPGAAVGIYRDGRAVLEKGYGFSNVELQAPVGPETVMQSGSVGKQFTATAVMMLVEQGKVGLEDSITKYFPEAPASWKPIKVKNLLSHTSGLAEYETGEQTRPGGEFDMRLDYTEDELAHKMEKLPIEFKPGDDWSYRNTNFVLLGILIHRATGKFYGDYLHDKVFAPLGMKATRIISDRDIIPNRAQGYEIAGGELKNQGYVSPTLNTTADGALYFNVIDLEKWDRALYGTSLLTKASLNRMWTPFLLNDGKPNPSGYGFAWGITQVNGHRVIEHGGAWQGFTCHISRYVDDKLTVVVLTNLDSAHASPKNIARVVAGLVEPALMPKPEQAIADTRPEITANLRSVMRKIVTGANVSADFAPEAGYKFDTTDAAEMRNSLPTGWENSSATLVKRTESKGQVSSSYKFGHPGDTRIVLLQTDASGKIHSLSVMPDSDNR